MGCVIRTKDTPMTQMKVSDKRPLPLRKFQGFQELCAKEPGTTSKIYFPLFYTDKTKMLHLIWCSYVSERVNTLHRGPS